MPKRVVHTQTFVPNQNQNQTQRQPDVRIVHQGVHNGGINVHQPRLVIHQRQLVQRNGATLLQLAQQQQQAPAPTQTIIVPQGTTVVVHQGPNSGPHRGPRPF